MKLRVLSAATVAAAILATIVGGSIVLRSDYGSELQVELQYRHVQYEVVFE